MLRVENISAGYGKKQVLFDVSFEVKEGEVVLLTGGNGSGKSTLFKCIYNLLPLWGGSVWFKNERIDGLKTHEMIKMGIVLIPQKSFCFEEMTVEENIRVSGATLTINDFRNRIPEIYNMMGLTRIQKRKPFDLSGGERKRLALGMCLIHKPKLILFDEPFSGLDFSFKAEIANYLNNISRYYNTTLVIIEHSQTITNIFNSKYIL